MDDSISRQAALTALNGCTEIFLNNLPPTIYKTDAVEAVTALPSAQLAQDLPNGCTDTISRAAVGDAVSREAVLNEIHRYMEERDYTIGLLDDNVCGLPPVTPKQPGWIPCNTALPEHDGEYLVTIKAFTIDQVVYTDIDIARFTDGKWRKGFPVTAWCELPEPWEGDAND